MNRLFVRNEQLRTLDPEPVAEELVHQILKTWEKKDKRVLN